MADYAHAETDKRIEAIEKRLQAEYRQAYRETKAKLDKYLAEFARKDEAKRELVEKGKLSQADYTQWRKNQILTGKRWAAMVETLAKDMNRTNQIAAGIISGELKGTFALNANFTAYSIENGFRTDYGFTLYNEDTVNRLIAEDPDLLPAPSVDIPKDIRWNKQKISSNITQAVLQGKSIPDIAKGMQTVVGMNKAAATRNARTAMTGAQNAGRQASYDRAKAMGIKVKKEWIATLDGRTRHSHGMADGQQVDIDGKFTVGGSKMLYPGDFKNGSPEELYNCRCTMGTVEPPEILQGDEPRMTYQEWYKTKEGQEALEKAQLERNKKAAKRRKAKKKQQNNSQNGLKSGENGGIMREEGSKPITQITDANIQRVPKVEIVGYSNEQCEMIHNQHKELLNYSRDINGCNEVAFVFYNNLASRKERTGTDDKLEFKDELYGKDLFIMHNHPRNGSFSITDLMFFKDHDNIKTFSIVKNNGNVEYISRTSEFDVDVFKIEYMRLYKKIVINGTKKEKDLFIKTFLTKTKSGVIWSERK